MGGEGRPTVAAADAAGASVDQPAGEPPDRPAIPDGHAPDPTVDQLRDALERERAKFRLAAADALRGDRELADARRRIRELGAQLKAERARIARFRERRLVRIARRLLGVVRRVRGALNGPRTGAMVPASGTPGSGGRVAPAPLDVRAVPEQVRRERLARWLRLAEADRPATVVLVGEASGNDGAALASLGGNLDRRGYRVSRVVAAEALAATGPADVVVALPSVDPLTLPLGPVRVRLDPAAAAPSDPGDWDLAVPAAAEADGAIVAAVESWLGAGRVSIRLPAGNAEIGAHWGDTFLARDLRTALRAIGWPTRIHYVDAWQDPAVGWDDVILDLLGVQTDRPSVGSCRILWQISHPELAEPDVYRRYDAWFVASDRFAARMAALTGLPIEPLYQATDPNRFRPGLPGPATELLFVANWRAGRPILTDLMPTSHRLAVYGRGWTADRLDPAVHAGDFIPNDQVAGHYANATIVLNDHWPAMRREGFLSNRLYDATAAGAFIISDDVEGLDDTFDGGIVGYRDAGHLRQLVDRYLADAAARRAAADRARAAVLERHTFAHRARAIVEAAESRLTRTG